MSDHDHDGSQRGSGRPDPPSPRSEIGGPTGGAPEDLRRYVAALCRRVLHLSNELRQATRRAAEATDLNREHVCSLESLEMMCANEDREIRRFRAEVSRLRAVRDTLQASLESDRVIGMEPPPAAPEVSALEAQIVDLNRDLDRRIDQIRHLQTHIDDLARDRGNLESTIHHLASEMAQAGGKILDLQQDNRDLDRSRETRSLPYLRPSPDPRPVVEITPLPSVGLLMDPEDLQVDPEDLQVDPTDRTLMRDPDIRAMGLAQQVVLAQQVDLARGQRQSVASGRAMYRDFEASELIAYWASTHQFPITAAMIAQSPWLGSFAKQRNNCRSHAGNRWKRMLLTLIQTMIERWCDLNLLLDPFFLHVPKRTDQVAWYPGIEARRANLVDPQLNRGEPTDLLEALAEADTADPWRNHYRDHTADHPARRLPRLDRKFFDLQVAQPSASS
ncbi:Hypothetical protein PHPALM_36760 [Phytophthora palmivora]|uniref:Uncharacterized protein n=1 Tax=Phytophthora palmivora TaxID=4796 RepID=A0A2P4WZ62_9STRA|nr:Hypothetical protein PHPALM_36760 [Phytophthora palmivora]